MRRLALVVTALTTLSACAFPIHGKDRFIETAHSRTDRFAGNYQAIYRCFITGKQTGSAGIVEHPKIGLYPDLRLAEYVSSGGDAWLRLIEFRGLDNGGTEVRAYDVREDRLASQWREIESCAKTA